MYDIKHDNRQRNYKFFILAFLRLCNELIGICKPNLLLCFRGSVVNIFHTLVILQYLIIPMTITISCIIRSDVCMIKLFPVLLFLVFVVLFFQFKGRSVSTRNLVFICYYGNYAEIIAYLANLYETRSADLFSQRCL